MRRNLPPPDDYDDPSESFEVEHAKAYLFVLLRHRWLIAATVAGILAVTCVGTLLQTPQFRAAALVRIDQGKINLGQELTVDESRPGFREFYGTQERVLMSRTLAQGTMDQLDLWSHPLFELPVGFEDVGGEAGRNRQIDRFLALLQVTHVRNTQIMEVTFLSPEPELTRDLANALVHESIAYNVEADSGIARDTTSFIGEQIEKLQRGIHEKEMLLQEYGKQQDIVHDQSDDILAQQLSELHHELTQAESELANAGAHYSSLKQSDPGSFPEVFNSRAIQDLGREHTKRRSTSSWA